MPPPLAPSATLASSTCMNVSTLSKPSLEDQVVQTFLGWSQMCAHGCNHALRVKMQRHRLPGRTALAIHAGVPPMNGVSLQLIYKTMCRILCKQFSPHRDLQRCPCKTTCDHLVRQQLPPYPRRRGPLSIPHHHPTANVLQPHFLSDPPPALSLWSGLRVYSPLRHPVLSLPRGCSPMLVYRSSLSETSLEIRDVVGLMLVLSPHARHSPDTDTDML